MKRTNLYCVKEDGIYQHFYPAPEVVRMCGVEVKDILHVAVIEDPDGDYWAWYDSKDDCFTLVYHDKLLLGMCFPYGLEAAIKAEQGNAYQVRIEELDF